MAKVKSLKDNLGLDGKTKGKVIAKIGSQKFDRILLYLSKVIKDCYESDPELFYQELSDVVNIRAERKNRAENKLFVLGGRKMPIVPNTISDKLDFFQDMKFVLKQCGSDLIKSVAS